MIGPIYQEIFNVNFMAQSTQLKSFSAGPSLYFQIATFISDYKKLIILVASLIFLILSFIYKGVNSKTKKDEFIAASDQYDHFIKNKKITSEEVESFKKLFKKHPELKPFYQSGIIQQCLSLGQLDLVDSFVKEHKLLQGSYFSRFSEITLFIEKNEHQKALEESLLLKEDLLAEDQRVASKYSHLFFHNLYRVAFLSARLGKKEGERLAWKELKKYSETEVTKTADGVKFDRQAYEALSDQFSDQSLSIQDYIKHREKLLALLD